MKNQKQTIKKIVGFLNNEDEDGGGFWLPSIQRSFVWSEEQTCRLFDSILREYPISTLLVWKTKSTIRRRKFIDNFLPEHRHHLTTLYVPQDNKKKCLVLDGQQRLQSLFIGLKGSYEGRELFLDMLSGEVAAPDDVKFKFAFLDPSTCVFPWTKFKDLVFSNQDPVSEAEDLIAKAGRDLTLEERKTVSRHVGLVFKTFLSDDGIAYQELDSIDNPDLYTEDDVVEVFIRANSGGTQLSKSDLLFSLLEASWDVADQKMEDLLESLNKFGFAFDRDFVLKTCLVLLGQGARYEVAKFRKPGVRQDIESNWEKIAEAIEDVLDFVRSKTFIHCNKALPTYLVLIPLVYLRYHFVDAWKKAKNLDTYLLRCSLAGAFSGQPDNLIDALVKKLAEFKSFSVDESFDVIRTQNRSLELTEERFWQMGYGSGTIHLLFNLWYRDFNQTPAYENNLPQVDHIFPQSALRKVKVQNPKTGKMDLMKYHDAERNQFANCMLLSKEENGAGGKWDTLPEDWFTDKDEDYLNMHSIPADPDLWKMERFEDFIIERQILIRERFKLLLVPTATLQTATATAGKI